METRGCHIIPEVIRKPRRMCAKNRFIWKPFCKFQILRSQNFVDDDRNMRDSFFKKR